MTDAEWVKCDDTEEMFSYIGQTPRFTHRLFSLFGVACVRDTPGVSTRGRLWTAVTAVERAADTGEWSDVERLHRAAKAATQKVRNSSPAHGWAYATLWLTGPELWAKDMPRQLIWAVKSTESPIRGLRRRYANIFRDLFGNPFRPATLEPSCVTSTVTALAHQMYETRDFSAMSVLADALEDAGCDDAEVLGHCRGGGVHVRGCWVVDQILGKA